MTGLHTHQIAGVLTDKACGLMLEYVIYAECDHDVAPFDLLDWWAQDIDGSRIALGLRHDRVKELVAADMKAKREEAQIMKHELDHAHAAVSVRIQVGPVCRMGRLRQPLHE